MKTKSLQEYAQYSKAQKREFQRQISEMESTHREKIESLDAQRLQERTIWRKKLERQSRQDRENLERQFRRMKKLYQIQLKQLRNIYHREYALHATEMQNTLNSQMELNRKEYQTLAATIQSQLTQFKRWLQNDFTDQSLYKQNEFESSDAEQNKFSTEIMLNTLLKQLRERNAEIENSKKRIEHLEEKAAAPYARAIWGKMRGQENTSDRNEAPDENHPSQHDEILSIIKEIAQERAQMEKIAREPADKKDSVQPLSGSWGSRMSRRFRS